MGLINDNSVEMKVYLTEMGRKKLLEQGFIPEFFSISDEDVNYNTSLFVDQVVSDLTGDDDDNIYSISKNLTIKNQIIQNNE